MTTELAAKQARSEILTGLSALTISPDKFIYSTGVDSFSLASLSPFVRDLLGSIDAVAVRANVGAAATVHGHGVNDVAGLSEALNAARGLAQGIENQDPNLASDHVIVTNHINTPNPLYYWHITTTFYGLVATTSNRAQLAIQYNDGNAVYARSAYAGQWTNWARLDTGVPAGTVIYTAGSAAPPGFLKANGAAVGRAAYAELYAQIGTNYGAGDGVTTFNVPDLRAEFIRGLDDGRGVDSARLRGSVQMSQNLAHSHAVTVAASGSHTHNLSAVASSAGAHSHAAGIGGFGNIAVGSAANSIAGNDSGVAAWQPLNLSAGEHTHSVSGTALGSGDHSHLVTVAADGGSEGRPRNIALLACIKY
ncbi:tail fiber protein [Pseudomonas sp. RW10S2]|nr:tail fiber protein [Pseudomonas sp. RW10S2]